MHEPFQLGRPVADVLLVVVINSDFQSRSNLLRGARWISLGPFRTWASFRRTPQHDQIAFAPIAICFQFVPSLNARHRTDPVPPAVNSINCPRNLAGVNPAAVAAATFVNERSRT